MYIGIALLCHLASGGDQTPYNLINIRFSLDRSPRAVPQPDLSRGVAVSYRQLAWLDTDPGKVQH